MEPLPRPKPGACWRGRGGFMKLSLRPLAPSLWMRRVDI
jgi:hypothetical protein